MITCYVNWNSHTDTETAPLGGGPVAPAPAPTNPNED